VTRVLQVPGSNTGCCRVFNLAADTERACRRHSTTIMFVWHKSCVFRDKWIYLRENCHLVYLSREWSRV